MLNFWDSACMCVCMCKKEGARWGVERAVSKFCVPLNLFAVPCLTSWCFRVPLWGSAGQINPLNTLQAPPPLSLVTSTSQPTFPFAKIGWNSSSTFLLLFWYLWVFFPFGHKYPHNLLFPKIEIIEFIIHLYKSKELTYYHMTQIYPYHFLLWFTLM